MFRGNEIEVAIDVTINAGVGFKVGRDAWKKATDAEKRAMIGRVIDQAATMFANDVMSIPGELPGVDGAFISAEITGPPNDEINLSETRIYDPEG